MTDAFWDALLASAPPTIAALAAFFRARKAERGVVEIHTVVNSQRTEMMATIKRLTDEVAELRRHEG